MQPLTQWQLHQQRWNKGCGADACHKAIRVCLARGVLPCDVLLIGEAPGRSENVRGVPFDGPAGQLLDRLISRALALAGMEPSDLRLAFSNLVGCIPLDEEGQKFHEPPESQVKACAPRLTELVALAAPRLLVAVGNEARDWLDPEYKHHVPLGRPIYWEGRVWLPKDEQQRKLPVLPMIHVIHPAAILHSPIAARSINARKAEIVLRDGFLSLQQGAFNG